MTAINRIHREDLTVDQVREMFNYDPETGSLTRKVKAGRSNVGDFAGSLKKDGYYEVKIKGKYYRQHRIIWLHYYGKWPDHFLDHINAIPTDNRISNLRECSDTTNQFNKGVHPLSRLGVKNVSLVKGKYVVTFKLNYKKIHVGRYDTLEEAVEVARKYREELHGEFARHE